MLSFEFTSPLRLARRVGRTATAVAAVATVSASAIVAVALADDAGTRPSQCSSHFKDRNPRTRHISAAYPGAYLHEMSDLCAPYGQNIGTMADGSTFILYYADPSNSYWYYGHSIQLNKNGYVFSGSVVP